MTPETIAKINRYLKILTLAAAIAMAAYLASGVREIMGSGQH
jgi:hypothetical protein